MRESGFFGVLSRSEKGFVSIERESGHVGFLDCSESR